MLFEKSIVGLASPIAGFTSAFSIAGLVTGNQCKAMNEPASLVIGNKLLYMQKDTFLFYTASALNWQHLFKPDKYKEVILSALTYLIQKNAIRVYVYVIMPNHIHLIWRVLENSDFRNVQLSFMRYTAQKIKFDLIEHHPEVLERFRVEKEDREFQFWQRNPLAVALYSRKVIEQKLDYIHSNPLQERWNLANRPEDYPYSSAEYYETGVDKRNILTHYMDDC